MTIETLNAIKADADILRTGLLDMADKVSLVEAGGLVIPAEVDVALDAILLDLNTILTWANQAIEDGTVEEPELTTMQAFLAELKAVFDKYAAVIEYMDRAGYGGASSYRLTTTDPVNGNVETKDIVSATITSEQLVWGEDKKYSQFYQIMKMSC